MHNLRSSSVVIGTHVIVMMPAAAQPLHTLGALLQHPGVLAGTTIDGQERARIHTSRTTYMPHSGLTHQVGHEEHHCALKRRVLQHEHG
jgi:hypothetical protein